MSRDLAPIFADIDALEADAFVARLTPDVVFRFGNADPIVGREPSASYRRVLDHDRRPEAQRPRRLGRRRHLDRADRRRLHAARRQVVTVPNLDILLFEGDLVRDWQIYIDLAPVFA